MRKAQIGSPAEQAIRKWIADNYGSLSKVARETGVTPQHVRYVAFGMRLSKDLRIERVLKGMGCPIPQKIN